MMLTTRQLLKSLELSKVNKIFIALEAVKLTISCGRKSDDIAKALELAGDILLNVHLNF